MASKSEIVELLPIELGLIKYDLAALYTLLENSKAQQEAWFSAAFPLD